MSIVGFSLILNWSGNIYLPSFAYEYAIAELSMQILDLESKKQTKYRKAFYRRPNVSYLFIVNKGLNIERRKLGERDCRRGQSFTTNPVANGA